MVKKASPLAAPYSCYVNLTNKCNLRCLHCLGDYSESCDRELTLEEWKKVIDELVELKVFYINISGGEPTQHPDFRKIIDYFHYRGIHYILTTNGVMSKDILKKILASKDYLIGIKISLDGYDADSHCEIRRTISLDKNPLIFNKTMDVIKEVKKHNIPLTIATVLHSKNTIHFEKFVDLIEEINPISWFISPIIPSGRGNYHKEIVKQYNYYDKKFWMDIVNRCKDKNINVKLIDLPFDMSENATADYYECGGAISFCEINADGIVSPCTLCRTCISPDQLVFDNLREKSLIQIWNGKTFNKVRVFMEQGCDGCIAFDKCNKCIAQSFRYFGNGTSPTPYCIGNGDNLCLSNIEYYQKKLSENK